MLTGEDIIKATGGKLASESVKSFSGVSIDSRTIKKGEIFFALKGQRFDGHDFIKDAISREAGGVVVERESQFTVHPGLVPKRRDGVGGSRFTVIIVHDTLRALQDLAHFLRINRDIPVVAITGSNGKTTTKEMVYEILLKRFKVLKNDGNLNNHIGVPLSFLKIKHDDEIAVLEFGMNAVGEIRRLCEIVLPTYGVITNISPAHIGNLGSIEAVRGAKLEILENLKVAVINADDDFLMQGVIDAEARGCFRGEKVTFSINANSQVNPVPKRRDWVKAEEVVMTEKGSRFTLVFNDRDKREVNLYVHGVFNIYNVLSASAVCFSLGVTVDEIKEALEGYKAFPMRFEVIRGDITLINDSYNANPASMREALKELTHFRGKGRLVAVLGDMNELGEFSVDLHREVGRMVSKIGIEVFVAVGDMMKIAVEEIKKSKNGSHTAIYTFKDISEAKQNIPDILMAGDTVLVKGSRSMTMEKIAETINEFGGQR